MLLSGALFALFVTGFWLYCLTDAILTPAAECRGLSKAAWITIIAVTFIGGAIAWLIVRPSIRRSSVPLGPAPRSGWDPDDLADYTYYQGEYWTDADDAVVRHPATRAKVNDDATHGAPKGPDDDPEFLRALERAIRGNSQADEEI